MGGSAASPHHRPTYHSYPASIPIRLSRITEFNLSMFSTNGTLTGYAMPPFMESQPTPWPPIDPYSAIRLRLPLSKSIRKVSESPPLSPSKHTAPNCPQLPDARLQTFLRSAVV